MSTSIMHASHVRHEMHLAHVGSQIAAEDIKFTPRDTTTCCIMETGAVLDLPATSKQAAIRTRALLHEMCILFINVNAVSAADGSFAGYFLPGEYSFTGNQPGIPTAPYSLILFLQFYCSTPNNTITGGQQRLSPSVHDLTVDE